MIYEYKCNVCDHTIEIEKHLSDPPVKGLKCIRDTDPPEEPCEGIYEMILPHTLFALNDLCWSRNGYAKENNNGSN